MAMTMLIMIDHGDVNEGNNDDDDDDDDDDNDNDGDFNDGNDNDDDDDDDDAGGQEDACDGDEGAICTSSSLAGDG